MAEKLHAARRGRQRRNPPRIQSPCQARRRRQRALYDLLGIIWNFFRKCRPGSRTKRSEPRAVMPLCSEVNPLKRPAAEVAFVALAITPVALRSTSLRLIILMNKVIIDGGRGRDAGIDWSWAFPNFRTSHPASDQLLLAIRLYHPSFPKSHRAPRQGWPRRTSCRSTRS